jgi:tRNA-dihydrouridine synthase B
MIRCSALARNNKSTIDLIDTYDNDVPTGVQLMAANEIELARSLAKLDELACSTHPHFMNIRAIDLNFGCPSPEIIKIGAGPVLLKRRGKLELIFGRLKQWKSTTKLPIAFVGAKIRLGLNKLEYDSKVYLPVMELANQHLDYLTVHARHAREESSEKPHYESLTELSKIAHIPLIANGDITQKAEWERLTKDTGSDGALIARAAIKSPWIFRELCSIGPGEPSHIELRRARDLYFEVAYHRKSKQKFLDWHREGFRRMETRSCSTEHPCSFSNFPRNVHLK